MKHNYLIILALLFGISQAPHAQSKPPDSVVINVGNGSKITVLIKDKKDLETLKSYNFQSLMTDLITKIESQDTTSAMKPSADYLKVNTDNYSVTETPEKEENWKTPDRTDGLTKISGDNSEISSSDRKYYRGTRHSISFDIGTNNYLANGKFPTEGTDLYTVRPWGSWYAAINSIYRTRLARTVFIEWGFGASQYNFKFQNDATTVSYDGNGVNFGLDTRDVNYIKSKLSATFINASFVPVVDLGANRRKPMLFDGRRSDSFRLGVGPYAGYRVDSFARRVYRENGDKEKEKDRGSYHLNNFRYGIRAQIGFKDIDLFFNYDLNDLFVEGKGPQLNAFSFGISI